MNVNEFYNGHEHTDSILPGDFQTVVVFCYSQFLVLEFGTVYLII